MILLVHYLDPVSRSHAHRDASPMVELHTTAAGARRSYRNERRNGAPRSVARMVVLGTWGVPLIDRRNFGTSFLMTPDCLEHLRGPRGQHPVSDERNNETMTSDEFNEDTPIVPALPVTDEEFAALPILNLDEYLSHERGASADMSGDSEPILIHPMDAAAMRQARQRRASGGSVSAPRLHAGWECDHMRPVANDGVVWRHIGAGGQLGNECEAGVYMVRVVYDGQHTLAALADPIPPRSS